MSEDLPAISRSDRLTRLVDKVVEHTSGTTEHPLTRATVEKVVKQTLRELRVEVPGEDQPGAPPPEVEPEPGGPEPPTETPAGEPGPPPGVEHADRPEQRPI